jgi:glutathione S-transferase
MPSLERYVVYGDLGERDSAVLATALIIKRIPFEVVAENASLAWPLASRAGREKGPYLRTPQGFVLAGTLEILDWLERVHPDPVLLPTTPVRRVCVRLLEFWIMEWLPLWPRRSWSTLEEVGAHLGPSGFLLGPKPTRPDLLLGAWLESDVLVHAHAREALSARAPRLISFAEEVLEAKPCAKGDEGDDVIPISLTGVLTRMARDFHAYLELNQRAIKAGEVSVQLDLGFGKRAFPVRRVCEARRMEIGRELANFAPEVRRDVRRVLEPVGAWHALTLPSVLEALDPSDPRNL